MNIYMPERIEIDCTSNVTTTVSATYISGNEIKTVEISRKEYAISIIKAQPFF